MGKLNQDEREVIEFAAETFEGVGKALADNHIGVGDILGFKDAAVLALPAFRGRENVKMNSLKDPEKRKEAGELFAEKFDIPQDNAEKLAEDGFVLIMANIDYAGRLRAAFIKGNVPNDIGSPG